MKRILTLLLCIVLITGTQATLAYAAPEWPSNVSVEAEGAVLMDARSGVFSEADFIYDRESDTLTCPNACRLIFSNYRDRLGQKRYKASAGECSACPLRSRCISGDAKYRVVERAYFKWASEEQHMRNDGTPGYYEALRLRKIYCEGNFSHQKAEHNLRRLRKRGLGKAHEHCLLSATALNLKRMVKLLTTRKHPGVSLRKTLSAIGYSMELRPMALLSTGPKRYTFAKLGGVY